MSESSLSILMLGLTPSLLNYVDNRLRARGVDATSLAVTNSSASDAEVLHLVSSRNWSGIIIGDGVRNDRVLFERLIQIIRNINPNIEFIQHNGPHDAEGAIERHFNVRLPHLTF